MRIMKRQGTWAAGLAVLAIGAGIASAQAAPPDTDQLLPPNFTVYATGSGTVINVPAPGTHPVTLPTHNLYRGRGGGYVACYSRNAVHSAYSIGGGVYVVGQIRLPGHYDGRTFQPRGYAGKDISTASHFKQLCGKALAACRGNACWAGGDTGGWFGVP
jgi:hypothetical protein